MTRILRILFMSCCFLATPAWAGDHVTPLLGCTLTGTGTTCSRGSTTTVRTLPMIGTGDPIQTTLGSPVSIGFVLNSGTFAAALQCQPRAGDPYFLIAGTDITTSAVVPLVPACNDVRVNVTACAACNVSVYVLKEQ